MYADGDSTVIWRWDAHFRYQKGMQWDFTVSYSAVLAGGLCALFVWQNIGGIG